MAKKDSLDEISVDREVAKLLNPRGLPKNLASNKPFELDPLVNTFISVGGKFKDKRYSKKKQLHFLDKVYNDPFFGPYIFCISGSPHDLQAKMLAARIMYKATIIHNKTRNYGGKTPPKWETVYAGFDNPTISDNYKPSFLVLSNLTIDTSNQKIDKVRDALERHSNIPRIVIVAGCDPLEFFNCRLYHNLNGCIYLQGNQVIKYGEENSKKENKKQKLYNSL